MIVTALLRNIPSNVKEQVGSTSDPTIPPHTMFSTCTTK